MLAAALLPSARFISNSTEYPVYVGDILALDALEPIPARDNTGAIIPGGKTRLLFS